jgi:prepilin-type N-terminal cleavage/methylation domain-containing protein
MANGASTTITMSTDTTRPYPIKDAGFTLIELLVLIGIVGILSGLALANFSQMLGQQRLAASARALQGWLDEHRRYAIQKSGTCAISIDTANASLNTAVTNFVVNHPDKGPITLSNICGEAGDAIQAPIDLRTITSNGVNIQLSTNPVEFSQILFTFRGTSPSDGELRLSLAGVNGVRCIKVAAPLGLIRAGKAASSSAACTYLSTY